MNEIKIEKKIFTYPLVFRLIFRYGNILITLLLILYSLPLLYYIDSKSILIVPLLVSLLIIYFLNRHYFNLYKILPYRIEADDEKIICSDFFLSKREVIIHYNEIESLLGGIFENKISGVMKVCGNMEICIGFYQRLNDSNKLATIILSKVKRELYDEVLSKLINKGNRIK